MRQFEASDPKFLPGSCTTPALSSICPCIPQARKADCASASLIAELKSTSAAPPASLKRSNARTPAGTLGAGTNGAAALSN